MKVNSKEFWERVQEEYNSYPERSQWICFRSTTFAQVWLYDLSSEKQGKNLIIALAKEFLKARWWKFYWIGIKEPNSHVLFPNKVGSKNRYRKRKLEAIRKDFIKWCIEKYKQ